MLFRSLEISDSVDVEDLIYVCLTPSVKEDLKWNLYSGFIGPSTSISPISFTFPHTLTDNVYSGQLIMPPLKMDNSDDLTVTFEVKINIDSVVYQHTYHAELPVYDQYLMADTSYHYDLLLRIDTVIFNSVNIKDWVTDSITSPIIPDLEN